MKENARYESSPWKLSSKGSQPAGYFNGSSIFFVQRFLTISWSIGEKKNQGHGEVPLEGYEREKCICEILRDFGNISSLRCTFALFLFQKKKWGQLTIHARN